MKIILNFFRFMKAPRRARDRVAQLFDGMDVVPMAAIGDAYVIGFLQVIVVQAVDEIQVETRSQIPIKFAHEIFVSVLNGFVPSIAHNVLDKLIDLNNAPKDSNFSINYKAGRDEAGSYLMALYKNQNYVYNLYRKSFQDFIMRNYK